MRPNSRLRAAVAVLAQLLGVLAVACGEGTDSAGPVTKAETAPATEPVEGASPRLPNIVLFSIDTLRADHLGAYGYDRPTSPHIDAFAKEAVLFERAISQAPSTAPAHMSIFTGLMPSVHRVLNVMQEQARYEPLDRGVPTFTERLRAEGYYTVGLHGGGNVDGSLGFDRGFQLYSSVLISLPWFDAPRSRVDLAVIRHWLQLARERGRPLFLFLHHYVCHAPYIKAPDEYRDRFLADRRVEGLPGGVPDAVRIQLSRRLGNKSSIPTQMALIKKRYAKRLGPFWRGVNLARTDHRRHMEALYDSSVAYSDYLFDQVLQIFREEDSYADSIVALLSDHGEEFGEHGGREHGRLFVEHLHVPMIIKLHAGAGVGARTVGKTVRTMDLVPTLFDYLNLKVEHEIQATTLRPLIDGQGSYDAPILSYNGPRFGSVRVERGGMSFNIEQHQGVAEQLFDVRQDPGEQRSLLEERFELSASLRAVIETVKSKDQELSERLAAKEQEQPLIDPVLVEQLEKLGYLKQSDE